MLLMVIICAESALGAGAQAIAQALKGNSTLISLDLSQCGLSDMGGAQLALSLADNRCCLLFLAPDLTVCPALEIVFDMSQVMQHVSEVYPLALCLEDQQPTSTYGFISNALLCCCARHV